MASVPLYPRKSTKQFFSIDPLPKLLQTPSGLALLELQGTINLPGTSTAEDASSLPSQETQIGRLDFPDYNPDALDPSNTAWMKRVYLYVGQHQRLLGEAKKLPKAIAVIRRKDGDTSDAQMKESDYEPAAPEELEVVEIVKYKLIFSQRPEPVGR